MGRSPEAERSNEDDEERTEDWQKFVEFFERKEGFKPTYGDSRAMSLFDYYSKGRFHQWLRPIVGLSDRL